MPVTRSKRIAPEPVSEPVKAKSKATTPYEKKPNNKKEVETASGNKEATKFVPPVADVGEEGSPVPAKLTFSFEEAKNHLIHVDPRFADLFEKMKCRPYEQLDQVHPFRSLVHSILGQQISWLAARSVIYRFIRLYNPSLPEKPVDYSILQSPTGPFPTPKQVSQTDLVTLRSAGLSGRKAEYVKDLAARFADGKLSTEKLLKASDEELAEMLIEVKGIGRWTVDMFAIFSLRRPDILPCGDLGVQRGVIRWFLSLHSPAHPYSLSPQKLAGIGSNSETKSATAMVAERGNDDDDDADALPVLGEENPRPVMPKLVNADLPPPFTPSINKTLNKVSMGENGQKPRPLPDGVTVAVLRSRLEGKKKIKGAMLTPSEMEGLTECWKPYRSLGVYYMWALAEGKQDK